MTRMATVLAALDNSLAVNPVLATARALARVLGDRVEAIHVVGEGAEAAEDAILAAGVPLRLASGPVVERLVEAGQADDVAAMVIGARGTLGSGHALGSTALAVVTSLQTPVVVVPPAAKVRGFAGCSCRSKGPRRARWLLVRSSSWQAAPRSRSSCSTSMDRLRMMSNGPASSSPGSVLGA
jgi:nucleotide-binding universal stress UspA family protein